MAVANGIIVAWPSTAGTIPTGWIRESGLDSKYIRGAASGGDADLTSILGQATHTHTSPIHNPLQNSHFHSFSAGVPIGTINSLDGSLVTVSGPGHTHSSINCNSNTATNVSLSITVNANSSNDLPFIRVIWIKSDGTPSGIPANAYAFFSSDTFPTNWIRVQNDTYLLGAIAGGNGGGTGGLLTHTHDSPAHTHSQNSHNHSSSISGSSVGSSIKDNNIGANSGSTFPHTHNVIFQAKIATNQSVTTTINSSNHEPVFKKLNIINNGTGANSLPNKIIAIWGGTNASIPTDWSRFTSMDTYFVKGANVDGESNSTTGGSATHTHIASNCQPIQNAHNHTNGLISAGGTTFINSDIEVAIDKNSHTHTWSIQNTTPTNQSASVIIDSNTSESHYPSYSRIIFIQFTLLSSLITRGRIIGGVSNKVIG